MAFFVSESAPDTRKGTVVGYYRPNPRPRFNPWLALIALAIALGIAARFGR